MLPSVRGRAERDPRPAGRPVPPLRHPAALPADLAAARRDRHDRPERHPRARTSPCPTRRAWSVRRREPSRPGLHVVAEPGHPVRLVLPRERAAVQHVQRHRPVQPGVLPDLRPAAGGRLGHLHGRERTSPPWPTPTRRTRPTRSGPPTGDYPFGYKVVENGEIYQAKWYNTGDDPQAQVQYSWQTPWELLGPVLPGDHAPVSTRRPAPTRRGRSALSTRPATRCSTRACRTRPSGTTRGSPRRPGGRPVRLAVEGAVPDPR